MQEEEKLEQLINEHENLINHKIKYMFDSINAIEGLLFVHQLDYLEVAYSLTTDVDLDEFSPIFKAMNTESYKRGTFYIGINEKKEVLEKILKCTYIYCENICSKEITEENKPLLKIAMSNINEMLEKMNFKGQEFTKKVLEKAI